MSAREYEWYLSEDGCHYDSVMAATAEEALDLAVDQFDRGAYDASGGTLWVDVMAYSPALDESDSVTITIDPPEPQCDGASDHDWQSPEFLGGCKENPGVWGHGGGVIITECCMLCGCARVRDTWAQRPDTGEQGLESVRYEPGRFSVEVSP